MSNMNRRDFLTLTGGTVAVSALGFPMLSFGAGKRVVIVGGGIGGATAAKYIKMADASIDVTLVGVHAPAAEQGLRQICGTDVAEVGRWR